MEINNYDVYTSRMSKTIFDKCWWFDKIDDDIDTVVDYGCADGALFEFLNRMAPGKFKTFIGIDSDKEMRERAAKKVSCVLIPDLRCLAAVKEFDSSRAILVLNSVIHEILSYKGADYFYSFLNKIEKIGFKAIAIRDMHTNDFNKYDANIFGTQKLSDMARLIERAYAIFDTANEFISQWKEYETSVVLKGTGEKFSNIITEFLLKYQYRENWERELKEKYLWDWKKECLTYLNNYKCIIEQDFSIPFQKKQIEKDFGFYWPLTTHKKMLLERI